MQSPLFNQVPTNNSPSIVKPETYQQPVDMFSVISKKYANVSHEGTPDLFPASNLNRYPAYNPTLDNEELYAQNQSSWSKWKNGLAKFGINTGTSFVEGMLSIPDLITNTPINSPFKQAVDDYREAANDIFPNYYSNWEKEHPFKSAIPFSGGGANFWADKFTANLGFTAGMIASSLVTDAVVGAVTGGIGEVPLISGQIGKIALQLNKLIANETKGAAMIKSALGAGTVDAITAASLSTKIKDAARYGVTLYASADSEAQIEARSARKNILNTLTEQYIAQYGVSPTPEKVKEFEEAADAGMKAAYGLGMVILIPSNMIQWGNIMKPFTALRNFVKTRGKAAMTSLADDGIEFINQGAKTVAEATEVGIKNLKRSEKLWKNVLKPAIPNIVSEGFYEEGGQFFVEQAVTDYFTKNYKSGKKAELDDILSSAKKGWEKYSSTEGLENIFIGGLTGLLTHPIGGVIKNIKNKRAGIQTKDEATKTVIDIINNSPVSGFLSQRYNDAANTLKRQEDLTIAAEQNNVFEAKNIQRDEFFDYLHAHASVGKGDVGIAKIEMLKELPLEEQRKVMGDENGTRENINKFIDGLISEGKTIIEAQKAISKIVTNPFTFDPKAKKDAIKEQERIENNKNFFIIEDYKKAIVKQTFDLENAKKREIDIQDQILKFGNGITIELLKTLTRKNSLESLAKQYEEQAKSIQKNVDEGIVNKGEVRKQISTLLKNVELINDTLNEKDADKQSAKILKMFQTVGEFELGGAKLPLEHLVDLFTLGDDLNKIERVKNNADVLYSYLMTPNGLEAFAQNYEEWNKELKTNSTESAMTPSVTTFEKNGVKFEVGKMYTKNGKDKYTLLSVPSNNMVKIQFPDGDITYEPVTILEGMKVVKTKEEEVQEIKDKVATRFKNLVDYEDVEHSDEVPTEKEQKEKNALGFSKDISFIRQTGTDPFYETNLENTPYGNFHRRHQTFLFNIDNLKDADKYKIIPITKKTEKEFGLEGIIDEKYPNTIRLVYVKLNDEDGFDFINEKGEPISKKQNNNFNEEADIEAKKADIERRRQEDPSVERGVLINFESGKTKDQLIDIVNKLRNGEITFDEIVKEFFNLPTNTLLEVKESFNDGALADKIQFGLDVKELSDLQPKTRSREQIIAAKQKALSEKQKAETALKDSEYKIVKKKDPITGRVTEQKVKRTTEEKTKYEDFHKKALENANKKIEEYDAELAALEQSKKYTTPNITSADFEQFDLRGKEGRQAREQLRTKYGAEAVSRMEDITKNFEQTISDLEKQGKIRKECP